MEEVGELVSGEGWISDDSSYYGDDNEQMRLEAASKTSGLQDLWSIYTHATKNIAHALNLSSSAHRLEGKVLFNRLEGMPNARQLSETAEQFIHRLPPGSSPYDWLWCANPHCPPGKDKQREQASDVAGLQQKAHKMLAKYLETKTNLEHKFPDLAPGSLTRKLKAERDALQVKLLREAQDHRVIDGKWMLFPDVEDAPRIWKMICESTINGRLGPVAKIAAQAELGNKSLLICIYTHDFSDTKDVRRVVEELASMGLASRSNGGAIFGTIYYKCDAYTHLGIDSNNPYGLRASMYNSKDLLSGSW